MTRVDPRVHALAAFEIPLFGGENLQFGFQSLQYGLRKAVRQMKGHVLGYVGTFKVGEIAAAVPPGSANLPIGVIHTANLLNGVFLPAKLSWGGSHSATFGGIHTANREIGVPGGVVLRVVH